MCMFYVFRKFVLKGVMCSTTTRMAGKTIIVTGASSGIGKAITAELARRGRSAMHVLICSYAMPFT